MSDEPPPPSLNLTNADSVIACFERGTEAARSASCRQGSIDRIESPGRLIATGDLHDNPGHFEKVVGAAGMGPQGTGGICHLVLQEIIHPDRLFNGMDMSYRALAKAAALKTLHPEHVHVLLGNHELAQICGSGIVKDGVRVVEAFNAGLEYVFGARTEDVARAIAGFVRAMPLALRCVTTRGDILCAHSVPNAAMMNRFDPTILSRELTEADYEPRRGSAHMMVWGRGYDAELLEDLVERWGVNMFILGHEKVDEGAKLILPNAVVLNSDHARGVYLPIDLSDPPTPEEAVARVISLAG